MCARQFLMVIFVLTLIVVAGAFAFFQWGGDVLLKSATPTGHFEAAAAGGGPDYSKPSSWVARPGLPNDPSLWLPDGMTPAATGGAAVFYIHPTTYLDRDRWNAPLDAGGDTRIPHAAVRPEPGERVQRRRPGLGAALSPGGVRRIPAEERRRAKGARSRLPRRRRPRSTNSFAEAGDRPIILAGHSQGALQLERLLREKVAGKPIARRIVAAYVVGWPISTAADLPALGLPPCSDADQAGCILSWLSFGDPANPGSRARTRTSIRPD